MEINAMMSAQLASLQQTLQMSILDKAMNTGAADVVQMMEDIPQQHILTKDRQSTYKFKRNHELPFALNATRVFFNMKLLLNFR